MSQEPTIIYTHTDEAPALAVALGDHARVRRRRGAEPDVLHGVARHQVLVHAAREVALAQRAARDVLVALGLQAGEELVPQRRAGPVVVERERAALGRLALAARGAEVHFFALCVLRP